MIFVIFVIFVVRCISSEVGGGRGGRDFQRLGAEMRKERLDNLSLDVRGGSERHRYSDERVLQDGLTFMSLQRYCGSEEWGLCVMEIILYHIRCSIFSQ